MAFGRSRGKLYAQEEISVTFDDVAGIDEAVEELREVVEFLKGFEVQISLKDLKLGDYVLSDRVVS